MQRTPLALAAVLLAALVSCGGDDGGPSAADDSIPADCGLTKMDDADDLVLYSGRTQELVQPAIDTFSAGTGIDVQIKPGDSGELATLIDTEGDKTPADVFFSQAPGPLGFLDSKGMFQPISPDILSRVPSNYESANGDWLGVSGRVRVLVYNTRRLSEADLPASVLDLTDAKYENKVGVAPTNASFQDWVSHLRLHLGDDAALAFLKGLDANGAKTYANNLAIVDAVNRGEIDYGLVNHYYNLEVHAQNPDARTENHFFTNGDIGSIVLVSGAAILKTSPHKAEAEAFLRYLVSDCAQRYFAAETREFPLVPGIPPVAPLPPLDTLSIPTADLSALGTEFASTVQMIQDSGLRS